jgi:hypothetical protein
MPLKKLTTTEIEVIILFAAIIFGALFRFLPTMLAGFPINDGGMFATMINDITENRFIPPLYTTYNNINIPFAYPPLAFYIGAVLKYFFKISETEILRWLPALFNTLSIPAFYLFAKEILDEKLKASIATFVFAFTPHLTTWLSAGGGITRSLGTVFLIFTLYFSWKLFVKKESKSILGVIASGSLVVLSHTESTIFAIFLPILIWAMKSRTVKTATQAILVAFAVILIASPWYGFVISQHGIQPLLSALQTGSQNLWSVLRLINVDIITEEPYLDILGVMGILGMIFLLIRKDYFIPLMLLVMQFAQPRSAHTIANIPLAIAASLFITEVLLSTILSTNPKRSMKILFVILSPYLFLNTIYHGYLLSQHHITPETRSSFEWVKQNTPAESIFLIITTEPDPMCDSISEWFPNLTKRNSLTTLQGREWLNNKDFSEFIGKRNLLQTCTNSECLEKSLEYFGEPDYVYIALFTPTYSCKTISKFNTIPKALNFLNVSSKYKQVFMSAEAVIFEKNQ